MYRNLPPAVDSPQCPIANAAAFFPRRHPSATSAFKLGLASLAFGLFAGVPAILLSRLVLEEIAAARDLYEGERDGWIGLILGWVGTLFSSWLLLEWASSSSVTAGVVVIVAGGLVLGAVAIGKLWEDSPKQLRAIAAGPLALTLPLWIMAGVILGAGGVGLREKVQADERARAEAVQRCAAETALAKGALTGGRFTEAVDHLHAAGEACVGAEKAAITELEASLPDREAAYRRQRAQEEAERRVKAAAERERRAVERFQAQAEVIRRHLDASAANASQSRWLDVRDELAVAARWLEEFTGTNVTTSDEYVQLKRRHDELKGRSARSIEKALKVREAEAEAARKREEAQERARAAAAAAREANRHVVCCDGVVSPSCLCAADSHRGCCSHHGGICGCQD